MIFRVITDAPFSLDGVRPAPYKEGDVFEVSDVDFAETLIRNEIAMPVEADELKPVEPANEEANEAPIAIIEANAFDDKGDLQRYAEQEHEIKLSKVKKLENMKADFAEKYVAKVEAIEDHNEV